MTILEGTLLILVMNTTPFDRLLGKQLFFSKVLKKNLKMNKVCSHLIFFYSELLCSTVPVLYLWCLTSHFSVHLLCNHSIHSFSHLSP